MFPRKNRRLSNLGEKLRQIRNRPDIDLLHNGDELVSEIGISESFAQPVKFFHDSVPGHGQSAIRSEQHEDINLITLLVGASADGLQILSNSGQWVPVTSLPDQIVVNVGDMLQRLTNNRLKSTTHRVVNPPKAFWHTSRFSIPFFLHPRSRMSLACLESCVDADHPKTYPDVTAGEYLDERLREIGLKK